MVDRPRAVAAFLSLPLIALLVLLLAFPFGFDLYLSITDWQLNRGQWWDANVIGLDNYSEAFGDTRFWQALLRTVGFVVVALSIEFALGLALALAFAQRFAGRRVLMAMVLVPMMILPVVNGFIFFMLFQADGPVNSILGAVSGSQVDTAWLSDGWTAALVIVLADVYQWTPLMFLILLAGVMAVPENLRQAASVLGATPFQQFRTVVLPLMRPVILVALIVRGIELFKLFDTVFIITEGGPGTSTETISTYLYEVTLSDFRLAYGAALSFIVLVMLAVVAMRAVKFLHAREEAEAPA